MSLIDIKIVTNMNNPIHSYNYITKNYYAYYFLISPYNFDLSQCKGGLLGSCFGV